MEINESLKVKPSIIEGLGIFTEKKILKGETIYIFNGNKFSLKELMENKKLNFILDWNYLQISEEEYLYPTDNLGKINHSCDPNSFIKGKNQLIALKDILPGAEITFDYSTTMFEDKEKIEKVSKNVAWTMKCNCGTENCRKIIGQFYELPLDIQKKYLESKTVPDFILEHKYLVLEQEI